MFPEIADCLEQAAALGCLSVRFTGGEPLLRNDFIDIYRFARKLGIRVRLLTNATLITPEIARLFEEMPPLLPVEITLYGISAESEIEITRSPGSFEASRRGIQLLSSHHVPHIFKWTVLPRNIHELKLFEQISSTSSSDEDPPPVNISLHLRARRDSEKKNARIRSLRLSPEERLSIISRNPEKYRRAMLSYFHERPARNGSLFECGAGHNCSMDAYGIVQMCLLLRHPETVYDLRNGNLEDAVTRFFPEVRKRSAENLEYRDRCANCAIITLCDQCPASSWMEHGTLDTPVEYLCECAHAEAEFLKII
jgi:radical SAM protein with 4Fe4S-binding SPASM domain